MSLHYEIADAILTNLLIEQDCYICLHTGNPGITGYDNIVKLNGSDIIRKSFSVDTPTNHPYEDKRRCVSSHTVNWDNTEIDGGQEITHFTIWNDLTSGDLLFAQELLTPKIVGSDGVLFSEQGIKININVFAKP